MKNEDGSILLWTFMALTLFILLILALLASGSGMLSRSKRSAAERQQASTAKSVVDILADAVCNHPEETPGREILEMVRSAHSAGEDYDSAGGRPFEQWEKMEGLPREMGECRFRIWYQYQEQTIAISACTGKRDGDVYVLTLLLCPEEAFPTQGTVEEPGDEGLESRDEGLEPGDEDLKSGAEDLEPRDEGSESGDEDLESTDEGSELEDSGAGEPGDDQDPMEISWKPYRYREETR